ncbi:MAG: universal stress protein [Acidimicrobiia bacterium]|nr:universal stress protein [Acidimicrobiia bacterium]
MSSSPSGTTVIAAVDFSDHGEQIVREGLLLARAAGSSLHLVHVAAGEPVLAGYDKEDISSFTRSARAGELTDEHRKVRELAETLTDTTEVEVHPLVIMGPASETLLTAIDELNASHIVLGTHGHGGMHHLMFGSVAQELVRRSNVPVLLVPVVKR